MNHRPCDNFVEYFLETQRIMANGQKMFPYEAEVERDRDSAASVTEPCTDCGQPGTEICIFCNELYCDRHAITHNCVVAQLRQGGMR